MPVIKCSNGKYRIGRGKCVIGSKAKAKRSNRAVYAKKHAAKKRGRVR